MRDFFKILRRFIPPYKKQLLLNFLFNLLSALFTVFNLDLVTYSEDVGTYDKPKESRMYMLKLNINI